MANVKITELSELAAVDLADGDVLPIVDVGADTTKKVTIASVRTISDANDFATYTLLNANIDAVSGNVDTLTSRIDVVSGNVDAVEANVVSIVDTGGHTVTFSGNVIPSADGVYDLGSASNKWKELHLTGNSIKLGGITISSLGDEGITITGTSGEQANVVTPQLGGAANVSANIATLEANVASTDTRLGANIALLTAADTAAETRLNANLDIVQDNVAAISVTLGIRGDGGTNDDVTVGTEELVFLGDTGITTTVSANTVTIDLDDTAVSAGLYGGVSGGVTNVAAVTIDATGRITNAANVSVVTNLDTLQDNINVLDGNADAIATDVTALETRRAANVILSDAEDTAIQSRLTTNVTLFLNEDTALQSRLATNVTAFTNEDTALQARIAANTLVAAANDFVTFTRLNANVDVVQDNVAAEAAAIQSRLTTNVAITTAVEARRVANVTIMNDEDTALQARITANAAITTAVEARRVANVTIMNDEDTALQARIAANTLVAAANDFVTFTRLQANIDLVQDNVSTASGGSDGVEARRVANIAGAVSTITTGNLTASRALASDGSGKVAVATTTLAELNRVSGVTGDIQTQLNAIEARRAANNIATTFTDDVIVTGNLTVTGETVALNSTNKEINDTIVMLANGTTGTPSQDIGFLFNRGTQGNAAFFYDESATTFKLSDTLDPSSNTALSPVTASNLSVGIIDAATVKFDGTSVQDAISANVTTLTNADTALQSRLTTNVTAFTNEDTALQARIAANATITTAVEARRVANIAGAVSTITTGNLTASRALASDGSGKVAVSAVTATELGYLASVSSAIQTQLDSKQATITGAATTIDDTNLTASRALASDGSGKVAVSAVTATELGYVSGVSSAIQDQLDAKGTAAEDTALQARITANATITTAVEARRVANIAGAISTVLTGNLTADRVMITDGSGKIAASSGVTPTELGYLDGLTLGTVAASKAVTADANGDVTFIREVDIDGNVVIGTNASNTVTIVGKLDLGAFS